MLCSLLVNWWYVLCGKGLSSNNKLNKKWSREEKENVGIHANFRNKWKQTRPVIKWAWQREVGSCQFPRNRGCNGESTLLRNAEETKIIIPNDSGWDTTPQVPQKNLKLELFPSDLYKHPDHFLLVSQPETFGKTWICDIYSGAILVGSPYLCHCCMGMQTGCKKKHLHETDRMDLPDPMTEPGAPGRFESAIVGEMSLQETAQYLAFITESMRHVVILRKQYKSTGIAAKRREEK